MTQEIHSVDNMIFLAVVLIEITYFLLNLKFKLFESLQTIHSYKGIHPSSRGMDSAAAAAATQSMNQKASRSSEQTEESETENGAGKVCIDLSVKEFPLLPGMRPLEPSESGLPWPVTQNSPQMKQPTFHIGPIEFGSFGEASPEELASLLAKNLLIPVGPTVLNSRSNSLSNGMQKEEETFDSNAESYVTS